MSEESKPFTLGDVKAAHYAYGVQLTHGYADMERAAEHEDEVRRELGEAFPVFGVRENYQRGLSLLSRAGLVSCWFVGPDPLAGEEQLGPVDSPVWSQDYGYVLPPDKELKKILKKNPEWRPAEGSPRNFTLWALRLKVGSDS